MASWDLVTVGAASAVGNGGNLTLSIPAGGQANDLYVAVIAFRSTQTFAAPSGWVIHEQQNQGNVSTTTSTSIGSGLIASFIHEGTAPTGVFTRTGGNVGFGRILLYRPSTGKPRFVGSSSSTAAVNNANCSTAEIITNEPETLIVAGLCGADNTGVNSFRATDPGTASGALNTTTEPGIGVWQERSDVSTNQGADTTLGIGDAVKGTAGGTGDILVNTNATSRHVMVAAAFDVILPNTRYVLVS
jgi:hypothetical protein